MSRLMGSRPPTHILVRVPNWIGDAVMCLPALMDLREHFPHAGMTLLARPLIGELLAGQAGADEVMTYDYQGAHKGVAGLVRLVRWIRAKPFDLAVLFQNAFEAAVIAWAARIPFRVGYATDGRSALLSQPVPKPATATLHHIRYYQHLVSALTGAPVCDRPPHLFVSSDMGRACAEHFPEVFEPSNHVLIGINPGSVYGSAKRWMAERFAETGDRLVESLADRPAGTIFARCVLIGGKGEERLSEQIACRMKHEPINLSGRTRIQDLMGVLSQCALLVTNDTGPMHVAQALNVPVVGIFGPTDPRTTGPSGPSSSVVKATVRCAPCFLRACPIDHRCMTQISVDQVVESALALMGGLPVGRPEHARQGG